MTHARQLLALGRYRREERLALAAAVDQSALEPEFLEAGRDATRWLGSHMPQAIVVDESEASRAICLEVRAQARYAQVPMLSLPRGVDDLSFADVFSWGGDDVVAMNDTHALVTRLRALPTAAPGLPEQLRGTALIVDADRARRIVLGRVLRNAGYVIEFAVSEEDALLRARERNPKLVVQSSDVGTEPSALVKAARGAGVAATWIISAPPKVLAEARLTLTGVENATVTDGFAPPENVVFLANELERGGANDKRATRRLLYGTTVAFRGEGRETDDFGYTYNISMGGLYVRTLAPPDDNLVWVELCPPRSDRRVRFEGRVVWRRKFGPAGGATVPPGFGVAITDSSRRSLEAWQAGYGAFCESLGFSKEGASHRPNA